MELKTYQKKVMRDLSAYMDALDKNDDLYSTWKSYWLEQDIAVGAGGVPVYNNAIGGVPHVCMKVPTGGGKTFMACAAVRKIMDAMPSDVPRVVVWLVPSESILTQTIKSLSNVSHPYRMRLDADFAGRVGVYTKEMLLNGQNFSPDTVREMLTVCILSYGTLRINSTKKDVRKVYQENGNLLRFAEYFKDDDAMLSDTPDTALIQVLRHLSPIVIVDESHNAASDLSVEMLNNLNPSFVLDLTATPRKNSNIISYVDARDLKKEHMVKLPVVVYNRATRQSVIQDAIQLRASLENQAIAQEEAGGEYIRPIVLFQAQPNTGEESETFDKVKKLLIDMGIPEEQIAVKTSKEDDLGGVDLMSRDCPIRYIITVNALKEGWDCPFAYILASLANKTSQVDVEQILGRILRQPYAAQHESALLNTSYVLTCSKDFHNALENIVKGLNNAGFSRKDYRVGEEAEIPAPAEPEPNYVQTEIPKQQEETPKEPQKDTFDDIVPEEVRAVIETEEDSVGQAVSGMVQKAEEEARAYEKSVADDEDTGIVGGEVGDMLNQFKIQPQFYDDVKNLRLPQFFTKGEPNLFFGDYVLLEKEHLSEGFSLSGQDAQVSFELAAGEMYSVDIQEQGEAVPKYKRMGKDESRRVREFLVRLTPDKQVEYCTESICVQINKNNRYAQPEVQEYVNRIVDNMTKDEKAVIGTAYPAYAKKIKDKLESLENAYREEQFYKWIDSGRIVCRENYVFPKAITPADHTDAIPYSLYEAEQEMNPLEHKVIDIVAGMDNIKWWHRNIALKEFRLNAFINHYPDFIVMTKSGNIILIETKGGHLENDDSRSKLKLGRKWQELAGPNYRYFMVFEHKKLDADGSYLLDDFVEVMRGL
ncbi:MAG: DEAD/DEAH box helicase family protein [Clostridiales bacterium]|nr:DEAD/DEAH box helicase family protein [Clostridiales bacterium]